MKMEIIDLGQLPSRILYYDEVAFINEDRPIGIYSASIYDRKFFCGNYIFYRNKSITDFAIYSEKKNRSDIFVSLQLLGKSPIKRGRTAPIKMFSVSKEDFIGVIRQENHPALDWLLFNQELWNP